MVIIAVFISKSNIKLKCLKNHFIFCLFMKWVRWFNYNLIYIGNQLLILQLKKSSKSFQFFLHFSPHIVYKTVSITSASRSHVIIEKKRLCSCLFNVYSCILLLSTFRYSFFTLHVLRWFEAAGSALVSLSFWVPIFI